MFLKEAEAEAASKVNWLCMLRTGKERHLPPSDEATTKRIC